MTVASLRRISLIVILLMMESVEALNDHRPVRRRTKGQDGDRKAVRANNEDNATNNIFEHILPEEAPELVDVVRNNDPASSWMDTFLKRNGVHDSRSAPKSTKGAFNTAAKKEEWMDDLLERNGIPGERGSTRNGHSTNAHSVPKSPKGASNIAAQKEKWMDDLLERNGIHDESDLRGDDGDQVDKAQTSSDARKKSSNGSNSMDSWMEDILERNGMGGESQVSSLNKETKKGDVLDEMVERYGITGPGGARVDSRKGDHIRCGYGSKSSGKGKKKRSHHYDPSCEPQPTQTPNPSYTSGNGGKGKKKSKKSLSSSPSPSPSPFPFSHSLSPSPAGKGFNKSKENKSSKKKSKSSKSKAHPSPSPSPSSSPSPSPQPTSLFPTELPTRAPTMMPTGSPTAAPTATPTISPTSAPTMSPSDLIISPTAAPVTRAPTTGTVILNELCSTYESVSGNPAQVEFEESADLTCTHIESILTETLEMAAPSVLILEGITCLPVSTAADPVEICYEIATVFASDSSIVLTQEEIGELICISISEPNVDTLLDNLASLPTSNPFSSTTELTCNDSSATDTPTIAPVGGSTPEPISSVPVSTRRYEITQELLMPTQDQPVFEAAAARWESLIIGDLLDYDESRLPEPPLEGCTYPPIIDDLYICGVIEPIDGSGNQIGSGRANFLRIEDNLPVAGEMVFDVDDLDFIRDLGLLEDLILHEMGHVIGIGTIWTDTGVAGPEPDNCPYLGSRATAEYQAISGCNTAVPVQQTGGTATRCKHWEETCFLNELMTGELSLNGNPLSRITVGNLEDMGYVVDYANTDPYGMENLDPSCSCRRRRRNLWDGEHGEVLFLGSDDQRALRKPLREDLRQYAITQGKKLLDNSAHMDSLPGDAIYVGDKRVSIMMLQDDKLYGVIVTSDDDPN